MATIGVIPRAAILHDLSADGVALLTADPPPVGSVIPVWLALPVGAPSRMLLLRVIYKCPTENSLYRVGLACLDDAGRTILRDLLAVLPHFP